MRKRTVRRVWAKVNPITHAMIQVSKLTLEQWNIQITPVQTAVDRISRGDWDKLDCWQPVFMCLNRIESLLKLSHMPDHGFIGETQEAMMSALDRQERTGATALKAAELASLREMVAVYGDLLKEVSNATFAEACRHTDANVDRIVKNKPKMKNIGNLVFELAN